MSNEENKIERTEVHGFLGGHEIDNTPNGRLFGYLVAAGVVTLVSSLGVVQMFHAQHDAIRAERAKGTPFIRAEYEAQVAPRLAGVEGSLSEVAAKPALLGSGPRPADYQDPDVFVAQAEAAAKGLPPAAPPTDEDAEGAVPANVPPAGEMPAGTPQPADEGDTAEGEAGAGSDAPDGADAKAPAEGKAADKPKDAGTPAPTTPPAGKEPTKAG